MSISDDFCFKMPATAGVQGGRSYYMVTIPVNSLKRLIAFDNGNVLDRSQRDVNPTRAKKIKEYVLGNPNNYILPALVGVANGEVEFKTSEISDLVGVLKISMDCEIFLFDGQHRATALIAAAKEKDLSDTIPVMLYKEMTLAERQIAFADINGSTVKPAGSLSDTYNTRNPLNVYLVELAKDLDCLKGNVDFEHNIIPKNSPHLFTMKLLKDSALKLLGIKADAEITDEQKTQLNDFWLACDKGLNWSDAKQTSPDEYRQQYLASHGVFVMALALMGNAMVKQGISFDTMHIPPLSLARSRDQWLNRCVDPNTKNMVANSLAQKLTAIWLCLECNVPLNSKWRELETTHFDTEIPEHLVLIENARDALESRIETIDDDVLESPPAVIELAPYKPTAAWFEAVKAQLATFKEVPDFTDEQLDEVADKVELVAQEYGIAQTTMLCVLLNCPVTGLLNIRTIRAATTKYHKQHGLELHSLI